MSRDTEPEFNRADAPIQSLQEDLLERAPLAIDIANSIRNWSSLESLVIGISGPWGKGKTSVLNMVKEALQEHIESIEDLDDQEAPPDSATRDDQSGEIQILEFQPWQFTGIEVIARSFFQDLGRKIGEADESDETKEIALRMEQYGDVLSRVGGVKPSGTLTWRTKIVFVTLAAFLVGAPWARSLPTWLLVTAHVLGLIAIVAIVLNAVPEFLQRQSEIEEKTTSELREDIVEGLEQRNRPLVVLIDDVDRLTIEEVKLLFQLVRSSASFPNVMYVMGLDVSRIREKLEDTEYIYKIIQEIYDLPEIPEGQVTKYARDRILSNKVFGRDAIKRFSTSNHRWDAVFSAVTDAYFNTLRDINRFLASLRLQIGRFTLSGRFEANAIDLFAIHVLRVFEQPLCRRLSDHESLLCRAPDPELVGIEEMLEYEEKQQGKEAPTSQREDRLGDLVAHAEDEGAVRSLLAVLFPYASKYLVEEEKALDQDHTCWLLDRRVAHPFHFRFYFEQRPAQRPLSRGEEEEVRDLLHDPQNLRDKLKEWGQNRRLVEGLHFLRSCVYRETLKKHEEKTIVQAFHFERWLENQEQSTEAIQKLALLGEPYAPHEIAHDTINEILRRADSEEETHEVVASLLDTPAAFRFARSALQLVRDEHLLSQRALKLLQEKYAREVQKQATRTSPRNTLYDRDDFTKVIVLWFEWGDVKKATDWLEKRIEEGDLYSIARRFRTEEHESEKHVNGEVRFKSELIELLDGTLSARDLRENALKRISTEMSEEGRRSRTEEQKVLNALKECLLNSLNQ